MIDATKADEVMVTTMIYDHGARRRSYQLLAEAFGLRADQGDQRKMNPGQAGVGVRPWLHVYAD